MGINTNARGLRAPDSAETIGSTYTHITNLRNDTDKALPAGIIRWDDVTADQSFTNTASAITAWNNKTIVLTEKRLILVLIAVRALGSAAGTVARYRVTLGGLTTDIEVESASVPVIIERTRVQALAAGTHTIGATGQRVSAAGDAYLTSGGQSSLQIVDLGRLP